VTPAEAAKKGTTEVLGALGITGVDQAAVELIAEAVVGVVGALGNSAQLRAAAARKVAEESITDSDKAEESARSRT
jgi:hypothetical protein